MTSQVFYRKWRPQTLAEVSGQEHVTRTLQHALEKGQVAHAYLFCGPRGTGKTSTGRIMAKAVNCLTNGQGEPCNVCHMCQSITEGRCLDVIEVDAASNRGIDEIRDLREKVNYAPNSARYKVYIIDEVHMLTEAASNALLKTLEEPPHYVIFVLATTEPHKVLPTILSRCQRFDFRRLSQAATVSRLTHIAEKENIDIQPEALRLVAKSAAGSLRDAENLLEQMAAYYGSQIDLTQVQAALGGSGDLRARELARHIINRDLSAGLQTINSVSSEGLDLRQFNRGLVEYLRGLLLVKSGSEKAVEANAEELAEMKDLVTGVPLSQMLRALKLFGQIDLRLDNYSPLPLELALVECILPQDREGTASPAAMPQKAVTSPLQDTPVEPQIVSETPQRTPPESAILPETERQALPEVTSVDLGDMVAADELSPPELASTPALDRSTLVDQLGANWKRILEASRGTNKKIEALLRSSCEPVAVEGSTIVLGFYYPYHKEMIEEPENRNVVENILSEVLGAKYQVRCILKARDKRSAPQGHLVKAAMEMGARIVEKN